MSAAFACPYCDAELKAGALSCRSCGRDLTPILPLLHRLDAIEKRLAAWEADREKRPAATLPSAAALNALPDNPAADAGSAPPQTAPVKKGRRWWVLPLGFAALLACYWIVVLWLDLPLSALRFLSIALPFLVGALYFGARPRMTWLDACVAVLFAVASVAAMNALLGYLDSIPMLPEGTAAWRESFFYVLSISASMFSGMLLQVFLAALSARGLTSLPRLRESLLKANGHIPVETLKAIELTILLLSTVVTAITGLLAGFLGVSR